MTRLFRSSGPIAMQHFYIDSYPVNQAASRGEMLHDCSLSALLSLGFWLPRSPDARRSLDWRGGKCPSGKLRPLVERTPNFSSKLDTAYILGMTKAGQGVKIVPDVDRVMSRDDIGRREAGVF